MTSPWQFSPSRLRGHRDRVGLSRSQLGAMVGRRADSIKMIEYGVNKPSLSVFLSLADSLAISPNDLCRTHADDRQEYRTGRAWPFTPPEET